MPRDEKRAAKEAFSYGVVGFAVASAVSILAPFLFGGGISASWFPVAVFVGVFNGVLYFLFFPNIERRRRRRRGS